MLIKVAYFIILSILMVPLPSFGALVSLPQTGQQVCYDENGEVISCAGTGQDGEIRAGIVWPAPRFYDNEDGTITDNLTGLIWAKDASTPTFGPCDRGYGYISWQQALDYVKCLNTNNYLNRTTWRLPNINELESLMINDTGGAGITWFTSNGFTGVQDSNYWTSTTAPYAPYFSSAFAAYGGNGQINYYSKTDPFYVWPVSGISTGSARVWQTGQIACYDADGNVIACTGTGQDGENRAGIPWPAPRFTVIHCNALGPCPDQEHDCDDLDATDVVVDHLTGLLWARNANLSNSSGMTWNEALFAAQTLNAGSGLCGYRDWHLPNEKELHSLNDFSRMDPALPEGHPFVNVRSSNAYWSSTSMDAAGLTVAARTVGMWLGFLLGDSKASNYDLFWPVRQSPQGSDIRVTKRDSADPAEVGTPLTYTIYATNLGPADATSVTLTDTLPTQVIYTAAGTSQGSCGHSAGVVSCNLGAIDVGRTVTVTISVMAPAAPQIISNTAVSTCATDPYSGNNSVEETTKITNTYYNLTVSRDGTGTGTVSGPGISCGGDCAEIYLEQTLVTLTALADAGFMFTGWTGGGCNGVGKCRVTMDEAKTITAGFGPRTGVIQLPQTGQTEVYAAGDDGNLRAGVPWPNPRFFDNSDGTITDDLTGLTWLKNGNCNGTKYPVSDADSPSGDGAVTWEHALDFVKGINDGAHPDCGAGHTDWRLPNANEILSLYHAGYANPVDYLSAQGFINIKGGYWTSTTNASHILAAWAGYINSGSFGSNEKSQPAWLWPVRGTTTDPAAVRKTGQTISYYAGDDGAIQAGVSWPSPRFTDHFDGSVTDELTGLIWLKDSNCMATHYPDFDNIYTPQDGRVYWQSALDFVAGINAGTFPQCSATGNNNWRLPNRNELRSLTDFSRFYTALPEGHPFLNVGTFDQYWSSTSSLWDTTWANFLEVAYGNIGDSWKTPPYASYASKVWPVRSNQFVASADVRVSKTDGPDPILVGQPLTYTITVTNNGPSTAGGVTLTDTLPTGVNFISANSTQGTCLQAAGIVTCTIGDLTNLANISVIIVVNAPETAGSLTNTATAISTTPDPDPSNNTTIAATTVKTAYDADLSVTKTDSPDPVEIGHTLTYTLTVTNHGPETATNVVLTDTLPATAAYVSALSTQGTCSLTLQVVTCTIGDMAKDAVVTVTITVNAPGTTGTITNSASVSTGSNDAVTGNNNATSNTLVFLNSGNLTVSLSDYPDPVYTGQQVTYFATVVNNGPDTATGVTLTNTLPAGTFFKAVQTTQGTCNETGGTVNCAIGNLVNGASVTVSIGLTAPLSAGSISNTVAVSSTNNDPNLTDNSASQTTNVALPPQPVGAALDLARTGQAVCSDADGNPIDCTNTGQDGEIRAGIHWPSPRFVDRGDGTLTDTLTGLMWLKDANCIGTHYPGVQNPGDGLVWWQVALNFVYLLNGGSYSNCAAGHRDWRLPNVNELESLIYADAPNLKDWLVGQGFEHIQNIYWSSTTFPQYDNNAYALFMNANSGMIWTWQKYFTSGPTQVAAVLLVRGVSDGPTPVWKTGQTRNYAVGDDGEIQAGISWPDPRFADNLNGTVTDNLTGLIWLKDANCLKTQYAAFDADGAVYWEQALDFVAGINDGTYRNCGQPFSDWRLPNRKELFSLIDYSKVSQLLPTGHPFINLPALGNYWSSTSSAEAPGGGWGVSFGDGEVPSFMKSVNPLYVWPVRGGVVTSSELSIIKSASPNPVLAGNPLTYTITVTNQGPNAALGVAVTDALPPGPTFVSAISTQGSCDQAGGIVSCNIGNLANGSSATVTITVTPNAAGWIRNQAEVYSLVYDPNEANNLVFQDTRVYTATDPDSDGISSTQESGPTGINPDYDGNLDGTADRLQTNVTSLPTSVGSSYVTLASPNGTSLSNVQASGNPSPGNAPPDVDFPFGFFDFTINGLTPGGPTTLTLYLPFGASPNTYYKYGATPGNNTPHWYEFLYDGQTGAQIAGNVITLYFVDGQRGDDDLTANGIVIDQGGPGLRQVDYRLFLPLIVK